MSKLINVSDNLYDKLKKMKGKESFTITIENFIKMSSNKEKLMKLWGKAKVVVEEDSLKDINKGWKKWSEKYA